MNLLGIDLAEQPLDIDSFSYLNDKDYPLALLGFQLKNLYDQKRLVIKPEYNPVDVIHFVPGESIMPKFFRGIRIDVNTRFNYLINKLEALGSGKTEKINKEFYVETLNEHNLSCNNCFAYLRKGIYPIDSEHLDLFSNTKLKQSDLYTKVLDVQGVNNFQALGYFVIYVLSNKNTYNTTTKNFIHSVVKNYNF
jgi:hypothetical protein